MLFLNFYLLSSLELDTLLVGKHMSNFWSNLLHLCSKQKCHLGGDTTFVLSVGTLLPKCTASRQPSLPQAMLTVVMTAECHQVV